MALSSRERVVVALVVEARDDHRRMLAVIRYLDAR